MAHKWKGKKLGSLFAILFFAACFVSATFGSRARAQSYSLSDALDSKLVAAVFCGLAASSGEAIIMAIQSRVSSALNIEIPSGTVLKSSDSGAQDMVVHHVARKFDRETSNDIARECVDAARREEERNRRGEELSGGWREGSSVSLRPYQSQLYILSAFCLEFEKENPSSQTSFSVQRQGSGETAQLFRYLGSNRDQFNISAIQLATWAVSGDVSGDDIAEKFDFDAQDRNDACRLLRLAGINASRKSLCAQ